MTEINANSCRVCLKKECSESSIQFRSIDEDYFNGFSAIDMLNQLFGFKINSNETATQDLPQKICFYCSVKLGVSIEVWSLALESQNSIENFIKIPDQEEDFEVKQELHDVTIDDTPIDSTKSSEKALGDKDEFCHSLFHSDVEAGWKPSTEISSLFTQSVPSTVTPSKKEHASKSRPIILQKTKPKVECIKKQVSLNCWKCNQFFPNTYVLRRHHEKYNRKGPFKCSKCKMAFLHACQLRRHISEHHSCFKCVICEKSLSSKFMLNQHLQKHSKKGDYVCNLCGLEFTVKQHLASHIANSHRGDSVTDADVSKNGINL